MILKEWAESKGMSLAEAKEATGLTHWKQTVSELEERESVVIETESKQEPEQPVVTDVIEIKSKQEVIVDDGASMDAKEKSCIGLGVKSPYWSEVHG